MHSVEGVGDARHFYRVGVWLGERTSSRADFYTEFLLHAGPEHALHDGHVTIIERVVEQLVARGQLVDDTFTVHELLAMKLRRPHKSSDVERSIDSAMRGRSGSVYDPLAAIAFLYGMGVDELRASA